MENNQQPLTSGQPDKTHKPLTLSEPLKIFIFLIPVLLLVGFSIVSYKLGTSKNQTTLQNSQTTIYPTIVQPSPTPSLLAIPTVDPSVTANWKRCTNTKDNFSIKYPENFKVDTASCNYVIMEYNFVKDINATNTFDDFRKNWLLTINTEKYNQDISQWVKDKHLCPSGFESCSIQTSGPILNSVESDQINRHYAGTEVIVKINGSIFDFSLNARNPNTPVSSEIRNIYNQIVSTFKFLDEKQTIDTSDWKTYTNQKYTFQLKYPPQLTITENAQLESALLKFPEDQRGSAYNKLIHIKISSVSPGMSIKEAITEYDAYKVTSETISIGGINGLYFSSVPAYSEAAEAVIVKNNLMFSCRLDGPIDNQDRELFKQILSTFKFTDQK